MLGEAHISSIIVQVIPNKFDQVHHHLLSTAHFEVTAFDKPSGKIVAVIEDRSTQAIANHIDTLKKVTGVITVGMVYHHAEPDHLLDEDIA